MGGWNVSSTIAQFSGDPNLKISLADIQNPGRLLPPVLEMHPHIRHPPQSELRRRLHDHPGAIRRSLLLPVY